MEIRREAQLHHFGLCTTTWSLSPYRAGKVGSAITTLNEVLGWINLGQFFTSQARVHWYIPFFGFNSGVELGSIFLTTSNHVGLRMPSAAPRPKQLEKRHKLSWALETTTASLQCHCKLWFVDGPLPTSRRISSYFRLANANLDLVGGLEHDFYFP